LKVLHLASFNGNHGDKFNHLGFYSWFTHFLPSRTIWTQLEIRQFYGKPNPFDSNLVSIVNEHDLFIIGGGNYFETWITGSWSGTTLDLTPTFIDAINCPILINSVGLDIHQGISQNAYENLPKLLKSLQSNPKVFLSLRDDGSIRNLREITKENFPDKIHILPDSGYLALKHQGPPAPENNKLIINLASDMPQIRFGNPEKERMGNFSKNLAKVLSELLHEKEFDEIVFTMHLINDFDIVSQVISHIEPTFRRNNLRVTSYRMDQSGVEEILREYRTAKLVLAMRFHANVVSIGSGVPTLGINTYRQIENYFKEWKNEDRLISFNDEIQSKNALSKIRDINRCKGIERDFTERLANNIDQKSHDMKELIQDWLLENGIKADENEIYK
jgi:polysaccharide pyruvyl transferase WcaK-like protein